MDYEELEEKLTTYYNEWCEEHRVDGNDRILKRFIDTAIDTIDGYVSGYDCELHEAYERYCESEISVDLNYFLISDRGDEE